MIRPMTPRPIRRALVSLLALCAVLAPAGARADISLPAGFTATVYISGEGNNAASGGAGGVGMPSTSSLAVDHTGMLYLARSGRRYSGGEYEYLSPIYRVPPGGGRVTPQSEPRFFHGPPLNNAQVSADIGGRQVFVTTFDRDRRVGVVYRLIDGQMRLLAGGAPETGVAPVLIQPEGVAVNRAGQVFVADRERGVVVRLDAEGRVLDESFARVVRPRAIAIDEADHLWIGADSGAEAPWQPGPGQIWRVSPDGEARLVLEGPVAQGLAPGPGGVMFVAARQGAYVFALTPDGEQIILARFTHGDAPRALTIAPATPETRAAGLAGDLFVAVIRSGVFGLNEIIRISGPLADLASRRR
jgi:outer membrane protein assembly factor BamB